MNLPWQPDNAPLMLAPMQGLTNRALRALFCERFLPDLVFTEFVRVKSGRRQGLARGDRQEVVARNSGVPLVVQLIGRDPEALVAAAEQVQDLAVPHLNINLGCPYGRMTGNTAGGALLKEPERLAPLLSRLRSRIRGSFSVKLRSGYENPEQVLALVPVFEACGIDFLILHPRTVVQRFSGRADHRVTARLVERTSLPVIANGDVFTVADGRRILRQTGAAGLMLGRGAIADPFLFQRLRGRYPEVSDPLTRFRELNTYLVELLARYQELFCGEQQVLNKMKEVLALIDEPGYGAQRKRLRKCKGLDAFHALLNESG